MYRFASNGEITPLTQKVTLRVLDAFGATRGWRCAAGRGWHGERDAVADNDGVVADQNFLDDEAYDSLALEDVKRVGGAAQSCEERR
jgi:hypothetical protein